MLDWQAIQTEIVIMMQEVEQTILSEVDARLQELKSQRRSSGTTGRSRVRVVGRSHYGPGHRTSRTSGGRQHKVTQPRPPKSTTLHSKRVRLEWG